LIHGDKNPKLECALASFDSMNLVWHSPLHRHRTKFLDYVYFLLNICHLLYSWVQGQDEDDIESTEAPDLLSIYENARLTTESIHGGFFNCTNMRPELMVSAKQQKDTWNCGIYVCLTWSMFVAVERDKPSIWTKIKTLDDLNTQIVLPFWDLHENVQDRMIHFRIKLCRLMEYFLHNQLSMKERSYLALGQHPLPCDWVYPKKHSVGVFLPVCAGGPRPTSLKISDGLLSLAVDRKVAWVDPTKQQVGKVEHSTDVSVEDLTAVSLKDVTRPMNSLLMSSVRDRKGGTNSSRIIYTKDSTIYHTTNPYLLSLIRDRQGPLNSLTMELAQDRKVACLDGTKHQFGKVKHSTKVSLADLKATSLKDETCPTNPEWSFSLATTDTNAAYLDPTKKQVQKVAVGPKDVTVKKKNHLNMLQLSRSLFQMAS
jgi:hypothetical protein